jgi:hypothetical protein
MSKVPMRTRSPSSGLPLRIRFSLKSSDYVNVFPLRNTIIGADIVLESCTHYRVMIDIWLHQPFSLL